MLSSAVFHRKEHGIDLRWLLFATICAIPSFVYIISHIDGLTPAIEYFHMEAFYIFRENIVCLVFAVTIG